MIIFSCLDVDFVSTVSESSLSFMICLNVGIVLVSRVVLGSLKCRILNDFFLWRGR